MKLLLADLECGCINFCAVDKESLGDSEVVPELRAVLSKGM